MLGRGQTLEPVHSKPSPSPIRKGRNGEISPKFFGPSFRFAQQFKQVRRLQAYVRLLRKGTSSRKLGKIPISSHSIQPPTSYVLVYQIVTII